MRWRFLILLSVFLHIALLEFLHSPGRNLMASSSGGQERQTMQVQIDNGNSLIGKHKEKFSAEFNKNKNKKNKADGENVKRLRSQNKKGKQQGKGRGQGKGGESFEELYKIDKKWSKLVDRLEKNTNIAQGHKEKFDAITENNQVSDSYVHRKRHYEDIIVKDVFPTLESIDKPFSELVKKAPDELENYIKRNQIIEDYRRWKRGDLKITVNRVELKKNQKIKLQPLKFSKNERSSYFDKTVRESKKRQLDRFMSEILPHDPNEGDLPVTLRELFFVNLLRVVYKFSADPNYFVLDYFEENLNKEDYLKRAFYQLSKLKDSKTGTEILFTLENIYHTQERAWIEYFNFERRYSILPNKRKKLLHTETLKRVVERYKPLLKEKKIKNIRDIHRQYLQKRLEISNYILQHSPKGYRHADALYKKGKVYWEMSQYLGKERYMIDALNQWKKIKLPLAKDDTDDFNYRQTFKQLQQTLNNFHINKQGLKLRRHVVSQILANESTVLISQKQSREKRLLYP